MAIVKYGDKTIEYSIVTDSALKHAYITVDSDNGVVFKSPPIDDDRIKKLILKKARWILDKLLIVEAENTSEIKTGSRILYLGRRYYTKVVFLEIDTPSIIFSHSRFFIELPKKTTDIQDTIITLLEDFYREKAEKKLMPRIQKWIEKMDMTPTSLKFRKHNKRWGSCANDNSIIFNYHIAKLPYSLIDYIICHELTHIKYKNHSQDFWNLVEKYVPDYSEYEKQLCRFKI